MDDLEFLKTHLPASQDPGDAATGTARAALRARIAAEGAPREAEQPRSGHRTWRWVGAAAAIVVVTACRSLRAARRRRPARHSRRRGAPQGRGDRAQPA